MAKFVDVEFDTHGELEYSNIHEGREYYKDVHHFQRCRMQSLELINEEQYRYAISHGLKDNFWKPQDDNIWMWMRSGNGRAYCAVRCNLDGTIWEYSDVQIAESMNAYPVVTFKDFDVKDAYNIEINGRKFYKLSDNVLLGEPVKCCFNDDFRDYKHSLLREVLQKKFFERNTR